MYLIIYLLKNVLAYLTIAVSVSKCNRVPANINFEAQEKLSALEFHDDAVVKIIYH